MCKFLYYLFFPSFLSHNSYFKTISKFVRMDPNSTEQDYIDKWMYLLITQIFNSSNKS